MSDPSPAVVPSARAERRRISKDTLGVVVYAMLIAAISMAVLAIVALA